MVDQLSPDKDHRPFQYNHGRLQRDEVVTIDQLAEEDYSRRWGKRTVHVHLLKRSTDSRVAGFVIRDNYLRYIRQYPYDITIFYEVDLATYETTPIAGMLHCEVAECMVYDQENYWHTIDREVVLALGEL